MKYLSDLLEYFSAANITVRMFKHVIRRSLRGPAADWWELIQDNIQTINDFQTRFTNRYLCRQTQDRVRNDLEIGFYEAAGNLSKSEYVIRLYNQARMLSDSPREADIVDMFSRHFDRDVQQAVITQRITTIEALVSFLDIQEHIGVFNSSRGPVRYEDFNNHSPNLSREYGRPNYPTYNQSRQTSPQENLSNFRASTPITYKGQETPKKEPYTPRREASP